MKYAESLVGTKYNWYRGDISDFTKEDKFYAINGPPPPRIKTLVCAGLTNLMRRYMGLPIPGTNAAPIKGKYASAINNIYPGGTGSYFYYFKKQKLSNKCILPVGTLLLANYKDDENDQGHVAVVYKSSDNLKTHLIIHAIFPYTTIEPFIVANKKLCESTHTKSLYFTHFVLPENWIL